MECQELARRLVIALPCAAPLLLLASCASAPRIASGLEDDGARAGLDPSPPQGGPSAAPERQAPEESAGASSDDVFFNFDEDGARKSPSPAAPERPPTRGEEVTAATQASGNEGPPPESVPSVQAEKRSPAAAILTDVPEEALLEEVEKRVLREWQVLASEFSGGERLEEEYMALRQQAATRVLGLGFLLERIDLENENDDKLASALEAALLCVRAPESEPESRLLGAAQLARLDKEDELKELLSRLPYCAGESVAPGGGETQASEGTPPPEESAEKGDEGAFRVIRLAFAKSIEGPGKFTPLPPEEVKAGKSVLMYGEFKNFKAVEEQGRTSSGKYRCSFAASFKLLDQGGKVMGSLDFLPEGRGAQTLHSPSETVNFWARYRLPSRLKEGTYHFQIDAMDVLGGKTSSAPLEFRIKG